MKSINQVNTNQRKIGIRQRALRLKQAKKPIKHLFRNGYYIMIKGSIH